MGTSVRKKSEGSPATRAAGPQRRHELDWLRVLAVFGLIPFHVAIIFTAGSAGFASYVKNSQRSDALSVLAAFVSFWGIPLIFLVAGASAWFALQVRTPGQYVAERLKRLLIPFVFGVLVIVPVQVYFGRLSDSRFYQSYLQFWPQFMLGVRLDNLADYLAHLWFIPMLLAFSVITLPLFVWLKGERGRRASAWLGRMCRWPGVILLFGVPLGISLAVLNAQPVTTLIAAYLIYSNWALFIFFLMFFVYGYLFYANRDIWEAVRRHAGAALLLGLATWALAQQLVTPYGVPSSERWMDYVLVMFLRGFISWFWIVALAGLAMRFLTFTNRGLRYLNEAFYPVYVLHLPVLTVIGFYVVQWPVGVALKFCVIVAATLAVALAIYDLLIRRSAITRYLFGLKPRSSGAGGPRQPEESTPPREACLPDDGPGRSDSMISQPHTPVPSSVPASCIPAPTDQPRETNLAQLFRNRSRTYAGMPRWRAKRDGVWQRATYAEHQRVVNRLISGLDALGVRPGDVVAILSETCWEWMAADWAILGLGGVTTTIYASNVPATVAFILNDSGARYVFLENRAQYDKLMAVRDRLPTLRALILFEDAEQLADDSRVLSFATLQAPSARTDEDADAFAAARASAIQPDALASLVYTSGTTGQPKGVVQTHGMLLAQLAGVRAMVNTVRPGMRDLLFLPLSHVLGRLEHLFCLDQGCETVVSASLDHLADELREVGPDIFLSVPRVYEKAYAAVLAQVEAGSWAQRRIFHWATRTGRVAARLREEHRPIPVRQQLALGVADRLVFRQIREALGGRLQFAITGGAPLELNVLEFFHGAGALLLEGWGLTETAGAFTVNTVERHRMGTVGYAFPGHEIRIAADGEVLVRGPSVFSGYHHNPEATREAIDAEGWFHTGDIGSLDADGFLRIVDRKKDLLVTAGGKKIAPQYVEGLLKRIPVVSEACVYGDRKPYIVALLTLNPEMLALWAREQGTSTDDLASVRDSPRFRAFLDEQVARINAQLASYETVKYYDILPEDFTVENGLLTPTLKIRRRYISERYRDRFEALYRPAPPTTLAIHPAGDPAHR